jgi:hypothetical protein
MVVFTEGRQTGEFLLSEGNGHRSRDNITYVSGAGIIAPGTVIGKITASGKWQTMNPAAVDGSQVAAGVALYRGDATSADAKAAAIVRDAEVKTGSLVYHANVDTTPEFTAAATQLAAVGIIIR